MNTQQIIGIAFIMIVTSSFIGCSEGSKNDQEQLKPMTDFIHSTSYSKALARNTGKHLEFNQVKE